MTRAAARPPSNVPTLQVRTPDGRVLRFTHAFHIGRGEECDVRVDDAKVSRRHVLVSCDRGVWSFQDLRSANGVYADGQRLETATVSRSLKVSLGREGPTLTFDVEQRTIGPDASRTQFDSSADPREGEDLAKRYFGPATDDAPVGRRTLLIRKAFQDVQQKQKRRYSAVVAALSLAAIAAAAYGLYAYRQMQVQRAFVEDVFYQIKSLDVSIAEVERQIAGTTGNRQAQNQIAVARARRRELEQNYDRMIASLNIYNRRLTEPDRLILRVTRRFGECELAAPPAYLDEVWRYIKMWQSTGRFERGVRLAEEKGYTRRIAQEFIAQNLPPQFFYLALQESDFNAFASGPPTYMGIAKGMWQFVPDTGKRYGLTIGPLAAVRQPDANDDRHKWDKATVAAAKYIKDIYATDAQASGLLVMAGYNWGENRVIRNIRSLSANPKDRNFWKLAEKFPLPAETYNYVFSIVSAAVIGENPRMFGFSFDNPLGFVEDGQ